MLREMSQLQKTMLYDSTYIKELVYFIDTEEKKVVARGWGKVE
jgi:hypothetical protein